MLDLKSDKIVWINEDKTLAYTIFTKKDLGKITKVTLTDVWTNYFKRGDEYYLFDPPFVSEGLEHMKGKRECFLLDELGYILAIFSNKTEGCILIAPILEDHLGAEARRNERHTSVLIPRRFLKNG